MKILIKFPSRARWDKFIPLLEKYIKYAADNSRIKYLITIDSDDRTYNKQIEAIILSKGNNIEISMGISTGKIHACNRNTPSNGWDILVLASDDMIPQKMGWDKRLREDMTKYFPDTDGVLWYNDGHVGMKLNTMCILGNKYYNRFGYIYHPDYISLWCDNEFTEVSMQLAKFKYSPDILFKHDHPANGIGQMDNLYRTNEKFYAADKMTFERRKANNFNLITE